MNWSEAEPIGPLISRLRKSRGKSQQDLAEMLCAASNDPAMTRETVSRWERGIRIPRRYWRNWLAAVLDTPIDVLDRAAALASARRAPRPGGDDLKREVLVDEEREVLVDEEREAARFIRRITASHLHDVALEQFDADVGRLAHSFGFQPLWDMSLEIRDLRHDAFILIEDNRYPDQIKHLYLLASRLCGLQAHVWLDLGQYTAAETQGRTAWLCADLGTHNGLRGWVRSLQSLIAYWDGRLDDAVELARDGRRYEADGTISARLMSLEARACGALGDVRGTQEALDAAERAREQLHPDGEELGGVFTFSAAKQAAYAGTALLALGQSDLAPSAIQESTRAIGLYEAEAPDNRSPGDLLAARLDLASAHLTQNDLEGMNQELLPVLAAPPRQCSASIVKRAGNLGKRLVNSRYEGFPLAMHMREQVELFCRKKPAFLQTVPKNGT